MAAVRDFSLGHDHAVSTESVVNNMFKDFPHVDLNGWNTL